LSDDYEKVPYDFLNKNAFVHFQIINVGNDNAVINKILKREESLWNVGYEKIIGLKDVYSKGFSESFSARRIFDRELVNKFIDENKKTINKRPIKRVNINICFAIMEIEA